MNEHLGKVEDDRSNDRLSSELPAKTLRNRKLYRTWCLLNTAINSGGGRGLGLTKKMFSFWLPCTLVCFWRSTVNNWNVEKYSSHNEAGLALGPSGMLVLTVSTAGIVELS